jgi:CheY-like chemotaxis protein
MPNVSLAFAKNGPEALQHLRTETPDIILMDLVMPGMSGLEVSMHIRGTPAGQRIRIVSISGVAEHDDMALMNQLGITHFVPKGRAFGERVVAILQSFEREGV